MRHMSCSHASHPIDGDALLFLQALERGVCEGQGRGALHRFGVRHCSRCQSSGGIRQLRAGDVIPAPPSRLLDDDVNNVHIPETGDAHISPLVENGIELSADFRIRVRALSSNTLIHMPYALRAEWCDIMSKSLHAALDGGEYDNILKEARPKLFLPVPPIGVHTKREIKRRLAMRGIKIMKPFHSELSYKL